MKTAMYVKVATSESLMNVEVKERGLDDEGASTLKPGGKKMLTFV